MKRSFKRPRKKLKISINMDLREVGCDDIRYMELVVHRDHCYDYWCCRSVELSRGLSSL